MFEVIEYLESRGIDYTTAGNNVSSGWVGIKCVNPFCGDKSNHLGINLATGNTSCFKCSEMNGSIIKLIKIVDDCSTSEAYEIKKQFDSDRIFLPEKKRRVQSVILPKHAKHPLPERHRQYLEGRNFDPDLLTEKYELYGCELGKDYQYRIIIPVFLNRKIVSFTGRAIIEAAVRYKNNPKEKSILAVKETLYNFDTVEESIVLVEGPFDAWRIGDSCCASFGTKVTSDQISMMRKCKNVFIMFDREAKEEAEQLSYNLSGIVDHVEIITIDEKDPAEMKESDVKHLRKELGI